MRKWTCLSLLLLISPVKASILPENDLVIPLTDKNKGLSEHDYHSVIDMVEASYRPEIEALGKKLTINRLWDSPRVNAGTVRSKDEWIINLYGGYARHPLITKDGYALVICHELGHHLGGAPHKVREGKTRWPSVEGQSDYFATQTCLKKVFGGEKAEEIRVLCSSVDQSSICKRILRAGLSVSAISAQIRRTSMPSYLTPDSTHVTELFQDHPEPQCRLDTYLAGTLNEKRPGCWYKQK